MVDKKIIRNHSRRLSQLWLQLENLQDKVWLQKRCWLRFAKAVLTDFLKLKSLAGACWTTQVRLSQRPSEAALLSQGWCLLAKPCCPCIGTGKLRQQDPELDSAAERWYNPQMGVYSETLGHLIRTARESSSTSDLVSVNTCAARSHEHNLEHNFFSCFANYRDYSWLENAAIWKGVGKSFSILLELNPYCLPQWDWCEPMSQVGRIGWPPNINLKCT